MATFIDWVFQPHVAEGGTSDARSCASQPVWRTGAWARYFPPIGTLPAEVGQLWGSKDSDQSCRETLKGATNEVSLAPVVH